MKVIGPLIGLVVLAWFLIIAEAYLFFNVILLVQPIHSMGAFTFLAIIKIGATFGLGVLWFVLVGTLSNYYVKSRLNRQTPTSTS